MMRNILLIILVSFISAGLFSCSTFEQDDKKAKTIQDADQLYEKYKNMVTEGEGCAPCIDCAALALAISYDTQQEIAASKEKLLDYYNVNGSIPCPELLPELNTELALIVDPE